MKKRVLMGLWAMLMGIGMMATSYTNPILPYDYSDPDVCRVGQEYVMTSSSFNNVPGLQILVSKDLVHWELRDAAIRYRLPGMEDGDKVLGNFVWAPSIREHNGWLYIFYGDPDRGIYCLRADISNGLIFPLKWEEPVLVIPAKGFIDPCPLWDEDGRVWLVHGVAGSRLGLKSVLMMAELNADALSVKVPSRIIFDGHVDHPTCEGPKLYKRNGYYYIMHPAGGVKTGWQVVQRSRHVYGPYQTKIVLSQGHTTVNGPHQGAWIEMPDGANWFIHFQDVGAAGRIVHMQPVRWVDDWPEMGLKGEPVNGVGRMETGKRTYEHMARRDEFDKQEIALDWQFAGGQIRPEWYFCNASGSFLRLYSAPPTDELMPNMLLQKIPAVPFTATARVQFVPNKSPKMQGAERAGLIVFGRESFMLDVPVTDEWCYLRLEMNARQQGQFYIGEQTDDAILPNPDNIQWRPCGEPFQAVPGYWVGAQVGFFCTRDHRKFNDAGWLDVDWFEIQFL